MYSWRAVLLALTLAAPSHAETKVDAYGLGTHPPAPEIWTKLDDDLSIRLRVLHRNGDLAPTVPSPETLRAEVSIDGREGADRDVQLTCTAYFMDSNAVNSDEVIKYKPCFTGRLSQAAGAFVVLDFDLRFTPVKTDPAGTSAVVIE